MSGEMALVLVFVFMGVVLLILRFSPNTKHRSASFRSSGTSTVEGNIDGTPWTARRYEPQTGTASFAGWTSVSVPAPPVSVTGGDATGHATLVVPKSMAGPLAYVTDLDNPVGRVLLKKLFGKRSALLNGATNVPLPDEISRSVSARSNQPDQVAFSPDGWRLIALQSEMVVVRWPDAVEIVVAAWKEDDELEPLAAIAIQLAAS